MGDIGDDDCSRCLPSIPVEIDQTTIPSGEVVVAVQDGTQNLCRENISHMCDQRLDRMTLTTKTPRLKTPERTSFLRGKIISRALSSQ